MPYQWHDTPNVRFSTIADFDALCGEMGMVLREVENFLGSLAAYRLARAP